MADIIIYNDSGKTIEVIDGPPPADQAALVAQLQADNAALTAEIAVAKTDAAKVVADLA
jgi:hypothetical protein